MAPGRWAGWRLGGESTSVSPQTMRETPGISHAKT